MEHPPICSIPSQSQWNGRELSEKSVGPLGPGKCQIVLVGEAPGEEEFISGKPFYGQSGRELKQMLKDVGINWKECLLTNVFKERPGDTTNDIELVLTSDVSEDYPISAMRERPRGYVRPELLPQLDLLRREITAAEPNVVVALGATALWALTGERGIGLHRGTVITVPWSNDCGYLKILPTYHPAAILRSWKDRPIAAMDLAKAKHESNHPELVLKERMIWIAETVDDCYEFEQQFMRDVDLLSVDVETNSKLITCVGMAPSDSVALVIPLFLHRAPKGSRNYFSESDEIKVWKFMRKWLEDPAVPKLGQNFVYDIQYFKSHGIRVANFSHDTMILHHALWPELKKGLGFLGSIYTNEVSWKQFRTQKKYATGKKDD